ncbi:hypothetical protein AB0N87_35280 [Streptomyces sp. NPDC093228]|uniref:hypothetical protein n=1 Tax=Streptomyces sp. NPDC093228 TaxID=3155070 RepID=UPI0034359817
MSLHRHYLAQHFTPSSTKEESVTDPTKSPRGTTPLAPRMPEAAGPQAGTGDPAIAPTALTPPNLDGLEPLEGFPFPVFISPGGAVRGQAVAERAAKTVAWLERAVPMPKTPPLFVVGPDHWDQVATLPVYGMPHEGLDRIVVGQQPAPFWSTVTEAIAPHVGTEGLGRLRRVYGPHIDLGSFADLLVSHELTHLANLETLWETEPAVAFWLNELAANLGLHGYVQQVEPAAAETLETVFEVTWAAPQEHWPMRDLSAMEKSLEGDGANYVWFEFGLQVLAKQLWQRAGVTALQRVVAALQGPSMDFEQIVKLLEELDPWVARAIRSWPAFPLPPRG